MANFSHENSPRLRLSKPFFYILILFLPFQIRKGFFTDFSFYRDFHAFYNTFYIYLTDLLILCVIITWFWDFWKFSAENQETTSFSSTLRVTANSIIRKIGSDSIYLFAMAFWLSLAISLIFSRENLTGLYGFTKIGFFLLLFAYIRENLAFSREKPNKLSFSLVVWLILAAAVLQSAIGIFQYLSQSSLGLTVFGEEFLKPGLRGVAKFVSHGTADPLIFSAFPKLNAIPKTTLNMRAYGTFPHPNVLAAFLFFGILMNFYAIYSSRRKFLATFFLVILCTGMVVTYSRLAWLTTFFAILIFLTLIFFKFRRIHFEVMQTTQQHWSRGEGLYVPQRVALLVIGLLVSLGLNWFLFGTQIRDRLLSGDIKNIATSETVQDRKTYGHIAWKMFRANPVFGIGLRNFVVEMDNYSEPRLLPYQHQPAHNIYLLILAESGIFALLAFLMILFSIVRQSFIRLRQISEGKLVLLYYTLSYIFFGFLFLGLFDHYFFSIQQGSLMFWLVLGMLGNSAQKNSPQSSAG